MIARLKTVTIVAALLLGSLLALPHSAKAQNFVCPDVIAGDSSERCANTKFVQGAVSTPLLPAGQIFVGSAGGVASPVPLTGDCSITISGVITCVTLNSVSPGTLFPLNVGTGLSISAGNLNISNTISAGGPVGSATVAPIITYNAQGQLTAVSSATVTPAWASITGTPTTLSGYGITSPLPVAQGGTASASASGTSLDNITGFSSTGIMSRTGAGTYTFATLSALMDSGLCSTQGSVIYRGASTWTCLTPGSNGQVFTSGGPAANPSWSTISGTGTVTSITCGSTLSCTASNPITASGTIGVNLGSANTWSAAQNFTGGVQVGGNIQTFPASAATLTQTIASGAKTLNTTAVSSASCSTVQTDTATGAASTDAITANFNGDPTAVTGYVPVTTGMLTIIIYPTVNTVNFKVCNNTAASITPGAVTINWRVVR